MELDSSDKKLIEMATKIVRENADLRKSMHVVIASVVKAKSGKIYKGINIMTSHSICAEQVAIGQALACGERELDTIVNVKINYSFTNVTLKIRPLREASMKEGRSDACGK